MMKKRRKVGFAKRNGVGYILVGTLVVVILLLCILVLTSTIAPLVLSLHAKDQPAMMTMPLFLYCLMIDFVLLEVLFLLYQPGAKEYIEDEKLEPTGKKKTSSQNVIGIVCAVLLLCSIVTPPCVCTVFTEQSVNTYVFIKTDSVEIDDVVYYELEFTEQRGLELIMHVTKDKSFSLIGTDVFLNDAFIEKYENEYGFASHLRQQAEMDGKKFLIKKGISEKSLSPYYEHTPYWEKIKELIQ